MLCLLLLLSGCKGNGESGVETADGYMGTVQAEGKNSAVPESQEPTVENNSSVPETTDTTPETNNSVPETSDSIPETNDSIPLVPVNHAPEAVDSDISLDEDTVASIKLTGQDTDGDTLTYAVTQQPAHGTLSCTADACTYTPDADYYGSDTVKFIVNDGKTDSAEATVSITVNSVNDAPAADAGADKIALRSESFDLNGTGTDIDGTIVSYLWTLDTNSSFSAATKGVSIGGLGVGIYTFTLTVIDNEGETATDTMTVEVKSKPFIITVKVTDGTFEIGTNSFYPTYNYDVDCDNDGTIDEVGITGPYTCNYTEPYNGKVVIHDNDGNDTGFPAPAFANNSELTGVNQWGDMQWQSMSDAFRGCSKLNDDGGWATDLPNLTYVKSMNSMFQGAAEFNQSIGAWDTGSVTDMSYMFENAISFDRDIGSWDTKNLTRALATFKGAVAFNQDIGDWNTSKVNAMAKMFMGATSFNQDIGGWDTHLVMWMYSMFEGATAFDQDIGAWDVGTVVWMYNMFKGATAFDQDIGAWRPGNAMWMDGMFEGATSFNQDISGWDTHSAGWMDNMFKNATSFSQDLSGWNVSSVGWHSNFSLNWGGIPAFEPIWN